jgi:tRNA(His) guanylyltransferase
MRLTTEHLMNSGVRVLYAYTQSDEISLWLDASHALFRRNAVKLTTVLAGEASARFSLAAGVPAVFDCRLSHLPTIEEVADYFRWRQEDAYRNAANAHA